MNKINFHQTFPPTLEYISRLLEITDMSEELSKDEISEVTSIPTGSSSGKVEPHINYAIYMGLVENKSNQKGKYKLLGTKLGNIIKKQDLGLQEEVTQLLCHARLTSSITGAVLWSLMVREILPRYPHGIKYLTLEDEIRKIPVFSRKKVVNMSPFYSTYEKSFENLKIIAKSKEYLNTTPQDFKKELLFVYAYSLLYEWEQIFPGYYELTSDQVEKLKFAATFAFEDKIAYQVLEELSEKGIIRINGQLTPFTVIKNSNSDLILEKLYSLLC